MSDEHSNPNFDEISLDGLTDKGLREIGELPPLDERPRLRQEEEEEEEEAEEDKEEREGGGNGPGPRVTPGNEQEGVQHDRPEPRRHVEESFVRAPQNNINGTAPEKTPQPANGDAKEGFTSLLRTLIALIIPDEQREAEPAKEPATEGTKEGFATLFQTLFAFITLLIALSFPIGVITLWLQLDNTYGYGFSPSLYAAAVTAKTVVVGKVATVLLCSLFVLLPILAWYSLKQAERTREQKKREQDSSGAKFPRWVFRVVPVGVFVIFAVVALLFGWVSIHWAADLYFLGFAVVVALVTWGLGVFWLNRSIESSGERNPGGGHSGAQSSDRRNWNLWRGVAAVYLGSIAVGVSLAGLQDLSLPEVRLEGSKEQRTSGWLLSNSNNYWYVINCAKELKSIPNKAAADEAATSPDSTTTPKSEAADWEGQVRYSQDLDCSVEAPSAPELDAKFNSGNKDDNITNFKRPTFIGTAEKDSTVTIYDGQTFLDSKPADDSGGWSITPTSELSDGNHSITAKATNEAGNEATSSALDVTIDTQTQVSTPDLAASSDSGNKDDNITNFKRPTFIGTAEKDSTVTIYDGQTFLDSKPADDSGGWSITPTSELSDGNHSITAKATDEAGNEATSFALDVTIDTQVRPLPCKSPPPTVTPEPPKQGCSPEARHCWDERGDRSSLHLAWCARAH